MRHVPEMKSRHEKINAFRLNMTDHKLTLFCLPTKGEEEEYSYPIASLITIPGTADMYINLGSYQSQR